MSDRDTLWLRERPRLLAIAYNILGSWADAEDAVSEAWLRLRSAPGLIEPVLRSFLQLRDLRQVFGDDAHVDLLPRHRAAAEPFRGGTGR